ncbi:MAG: DNA ligase-associated DEXH box helicase [Rhodobacteraceae bacterium]|jgi:ATP-dependent Lhr-like helicase|nr:DNA ligase-associated DEXH box helicase [Paracoccaceae bacterium]|tara:strand:+ start:36 stop:2444 length:2409 start_codon:yes stop_codon:yes gene_type:complete
MSTFALPQKFQNWINKRNWGLHTHQIDVLTNSDRKSQLLIAPTGSGKTLSGFLPTLIELDRVNFSGLHTVYVSPLKALAADIKRNLMIPIEEMGLNIKVEDRTGDTTAKTKRRQRIDPPQILLTTPESLALLISFPEANALFANLERIIIDEIHALVENKRGHQLLLAISRLQSISKNLRKLALSATVDHPQEIAGFISENDNNCPIIFAEPGPDPNISMLQTTASPPWSGAGATYAVPDVLEQISKHKTTLIFHNTRAQAEIFFHNLWLNNQDNLPVAIHHGSLDLAQRKRVEAAITKGELRAVVCTGTLDLGIDWNEVDLVIQVGAPKNIKRLVQRIGRANHTYNTPSKAIIVPANKFEIVECQAALEAVRDKDLDGEPIASGSLDVLCQHILLVACSGKILPAKLFEEIKQIGAYKNLTHEEFKECMGFCIDGGYALKRYEQWHRLKLDHSGNLILRDPRIANKIRMNVGTIQDTETLKVRTHRRSGGKPLGEIEEAFAASLTKGDTFLIGGNIVRFESLREMIVEVTHNANKQPKIATFMGTKFATSTKLSDRILDSFENQSWKDLPADTVNWLNKQKEFSQLPVRNSLLIETFFRKSRHYLVVYGFAGRNANQTLGLILSKKLEELNLAPLGFVANDYATLIWGLEKVENPIQLFKFSEIELGLDKWFSGNALMKRTFKAVASVSGLIDRNLPGLRKSGRQTTFSSDILYDTLVKYDPTHLLLKITKDEAMKGLIDFSRIEEMFKRVDDNIIHKNLPHVSPLAAPMLLEVGTIPIEGQARELLLKNEANSLMKEAGL